MGSKVMPFLMNSLILPFSGIALGRVHRPGIAGAVLQTPSLLINSFVKTLSDPLWKYLQNTLALAPFRECSTPTVRHM